MSDYIAEQELSSGRSPQGPIRSYWWYRRFDGRSPGYNIGDVVTADTEGVVSEVSPARKRSNSRKCNWS